VYSPEELRRGSLIPDHACNELDVLAKTNKGGSDHVPETPDKHHAHLEALAD